MAGAIESQADDPAAFGPMGFEERFGLPADAERNRRQQNKLRSRVREAQSDTLSAVMKGISRSGAYEQTAGSRLPEQQRILFIRRIVP